MQTEAEKIWNSRESKSVYFKGTTGSGVTVTRTKTVKLFDTASEDVLKEIFGATYENMIEAKEEYKRKEFFLLWSQKSIFRRKCQWL